MADTYTNAATGILQGLGISNPNNTQVAMVRAWIGAEQGDPNIPNNNPINTAWSSGADPVTPPGITGNWNWNGGNPVSIFNSLASGINATIIKLREPFASGIVQAIRNSDPQSFIDAVGSSHWGTNTNTLASLYHQDPSVSPGTGVTPGTGVPGVSEPAYPTSNGPGGTSNPQVSAQQSQIAAAQGASLPDISLPINVGPYSGNITLPNPLNVLKPFGLGIERAFWLIVGIIVVLIGVWLMVEGSKET